MTIRKKLILLYSGLLAIVILLFGLIIFAVIRATWIESVDTALRETADQVLINSRAFPILQFGGPAGIGVDLPQLDIFRASGVLVQAWSVNRDGESHLAGASENLGSYQDPLDSARLGADQPEFTTVRIRSTELRVLTMPIRVAGQTGVFGNVQVAASLETINEATGKLSLVMIGGGVLAVLGSVALGWWLSNQTLKPIEAITQAADSITTARDLKTRLPWKGPMDELGRLISVFNRMLDRLERLFEVERRLVADVSHELRTPLTAIRGNLDLIKRYGVDAGSLEAIESETERMRRLVNDLLMLARADYDNVALDMAEIDLDTVVTDVYREARLLACDRTLTIRMPVVEPIRLRGNADRLKQLMLNLVSNAIKFTPDGGQINLSLRATEHEAVLEVSDTGIGIQQEDLPRIFDRFYQADASRSRTHEGDGAGLGLSIARWIAEAHGGTIEAVSEPGVRTTFTVRLPLRSGEITTSNGHAQSTLARLVLPRRRRAAQESTTQGS